MDYWYRTGTRKEKYSRSVRLMGACHIVLGAACAGTYPGVGAYPGYYGSNLIAFGILYNTALHYWPMSKQGNEQSTNIFSMHCLVGR